MFFWAPPNPDDIPPANRQGCGRVVAILLSLFLVCLAVVGVVCGLVIYGINHLNLDVFSNLNGGNLSIVNPPSEYGINEVISADGNTVYVTEPSQNRLVVMNAHTGALIAYVPVGNTPTGLALTPNDGQVWVSDTDLSGGSAPTITVVSTATNAVVGTVESPNGSYPLGIAFSPNGSTAYVALNGGLTPGVVNIVDTASLQVTGNLLPYNVVRGKLIGLNWNPTSVAVSPDGSTVWVSETGFLSAGPSSRGFVYAFNAVNHAQVARVEVGVGPFFMALAPTGDAAYVADKVSCDITRVDATSDSATVLLHIPSSLGCPYGLVVSPDGSMVYAVTGDDKSFALGSAGDSFLAVNTVTSAYEVLHLTRSDPVTVGLTPDGSTADVVDTAHPRLFVIPLPIVADEVPKTVPLPTHPLPS